MLHTRICDLGLKIEGTILEPAIAGLLRELKDAGLTRLAPHCYLTTEWVVANETVCLGIPFYLARPDLAELYTEQTGETIWDGPEDLAVVLRHEMGHVVNYAYELFKRPDWVRHFGVWSGEDEWVREPDPASRDYVVHFGWPAHYAQKNPDEDWAETFAVWMTPGQDWRKQYAGWPGALAKLEYCDRLMRELGDREPAVTEVWLGWDVANITETLAEMWGNKAMRTAESAFVAMIREQITFLQDDEYAYNELHVYVSGITEPWVFGPDDEFDFDGEDLLVVRVGPTSENENEGVPQYAFPLRQVVATELAVSEE